MKKLPRYPHPFVASVHAPACPSPMMCLCYPVNPVFSDDAMLKVLERKLARLAEGDPKGELEDVAAAYLLALPEPPARECRECGCPVVFDDDGSPLEPYCFACGREVA